MAKLFGFSIGDKEKKSPSVISPVPQNNEDGVDNFISSSFYGSYIDIEGVYRTESDLIKLRELIDEQDKLLDIH